MLGDVAFGQYYPSNSFVHKMDSRIKILLLIAYIVLVFVVKNFYGYLVLCGFLVVATLVSKVPILSMLKSIKAVLLLILITVLLNVFLYQTENPTYLFWIVSKEALEFSGFMAFRLITLVLGSMLLNLTTTPVGITDGMESLLKPLTYIKVPVREFGLVMSIALSFIPILMGEVERIMLAQKARGANFEDGNIFKRAKALLPVLVPLLLSSFRRAEELGDAMDSRCYRSQGTHTKYKKLKTSWRDLVGSLFVIACFALVVYLNSLGGLL